MIFFSPLENIKFRECDSKGNRGGKRKTFWRRELGFCVQLIGLFQLVCDVISCEHCARFTLKFQGRFQNPFHFRRSSAGSAHHRPVSTKQATRGEKENLRLHPWVLSPRATCTGVQGGLQPLLLAPGMGHRSCLDPPSNTPR